MNSRKRFACCIGSRWPIGEAPENGKQREQILFTLANFNVMTALRLLSRYMWNSLKVSSRELALNLFLRNFMPHCLAVVCHDDRKPFPTFHKLGLHQTKIHAQHELRTDRNRARLLHGEVSL